MRVEQEGIWFFLSVLHALCFPLLPKRQLGGSGVPGEGRGVEEEGRGKDGSVRCYEPSPATCISRCMRAASASRSAHSRSMASAAAAV